LQFPCFFNMDAVACSCSAFSLSSCSPHRAQLSNRRRTTFAPSLLCSSGHRRARTHRRPDSTLLSHAWSGKHKARYRSFLPRRSNIRTKRRCRSTNAEWGSDPAEPLRFCALLVWCEASAVSERRMAHVRIQDIIYTHNITYLALRSTGTPTPCGTSAMRCLTRRASKNRKRI